MSFWSFLEKILKDIADGTEEVLFMEMGIYDPTKTGGSVYIHNFYISQNISEDILL